jgi:hypothetical protein
VGGLFRRVVQVLGVLGLGYALFYVFVGSAASREKAAQAKAKQKKLRASLGASGAKLRPLDDSIGKRKLPHEHKRWVLGLYNSLDGGDEGVTPSEYNHVHLKAELILNHLGLLVELHDVNKPMPSDAYMSRFRGVIAWYDKDKIKAPVAYLRWLQRQARAGRKIVLLNGLRARSDTKGSLTPFAEIAATFKAIGLEYKGNFTDDPQRIRVASKISSVVEFERKLPPSLEYYEQVLPLAPARATTYLTLDRKDLDPGLSHVVVVTDQGGYVSPGYVLNEQQFGRHYVMQWRLNPFAFFAKAFGVDRSMPRPDFTTVNGSRVFYSHIDGDGLPSITEVNRKSMCADFTRTQVLETFDLPCTVSFVVAGIDPKAKGDRYRIEVAQKIAKLDNVEIATHGFAHPMDWRAREKSRVSYEVEGYKMSAQKEIGYASDFINRYIAPPGKITRVMLWTGWCNPAEDQLAITYKRGIYNLNGGDPIMDGQFPSYLHLAPPIHKVGKQTQYFTSGPNDYILTEEWHPPYHRWANLIQTMQRTGYPRRIYPMNVYYHFYVVEKPAALKAMRDILSWVERQRPAPLFVSQYVDIIRDFETLRIEPIGATAAPATPAPTPPAKGSARKAPKVAAAAAAPRPEISSWRVFNSGYLRTIRFDRPDKHVDLDASKGVIGYRRDPRLKVLYVHLDPSHEHTIVLTSSPYRKPHVVGASSYIEDLVLKRDKATLRMQGYGTKYLTLGRMAPSSDYRLVAKNEKGKKVEAKIFTDGAGTLNWRGKINGKRVAIEVTRISK